VTDNRGGRKISRRQRASMALRRCLWHCPWRRRHCRHTAQSVAHDSSSSSFGCLKYGGSCCANTDRDDHALSSEEAVERVFLCELTLFDGALRGKVETTWIVRSLESKQRIVHLFTNGAAFSLQHLADTVQGTCCLGHLRCSQLSVSLRTLPVVEK